MSVIFLLKNKPTRSDWCDRNRLTFLRKKQKKSKTIPEMCNVQEVDMKNVLTFQPIITSETVSAIAKKVQMLNNPFTIFFFGGGGTHCLTGKTSGDYEANKPPRLLQKYLRQNRPHINLNEIGRISIFSLHNCVELPWVDTTVPVFWV